MIMRLAALTLTVCLFVASGCSQQTGESGPICVGGKCYLPDDVPASASAEPARPAPAAQKVSLTYNDFAW